MLLLNIKDSFINYREVTNEIFTPKDFNINVRQIWQWSKWGLITLNDDRKWERYSIIDILWLKTIAVLSSYGTSSDILKEVKNIIKKNYGSRNSDGMQNLVMALIMRSDIKIIINHSERHGLIVDLSDKVLGSNTDKNELKPTLTIPILGILKQIILALSKNEKYIEKLLQFGLLTVNELQLFFEIKNGVKEFNIVTDAGKRTIKNATIERYLEIILRSNYKSISYSNAHGQIKFNYIEPIINTKKK